MRSWWASLLVVGGAGAALAVGETTLVSVSTLPQDTTAVTATGGRPFLSARVDRGLFSWLDAGLFLDGAPRRFVRPGLGARARLYRRGCGGFTARADVSLVRPLAGGVGPRRIGGAADAELGLQADLSLGETCALGFFAQLSGLIDTDFSSTKTGLFVQGVGGVEWAPIGPVSLLARAGELRGLHGRRAVLSGGAALHF